MRARKSLSLVAGLALAVTPFLATSASAAAPTDVSPKVNCFDPDPDRVNGGSWVIYNRYNTGWAVFYERGEKLSVVDRVSDGRRVVAKIDICYDGAWRHYGWYDSGPNDGPIDIQNHDLAFKDGRYLNMRACEKTPNGENVGCGETYHLLA